MLLCSFVVEFFAAFQRSHPRANGERAVVDEGGPIETPYRGGRPGDVATGLRRSPVTVSGRGGRRVPYLSAEPLWPHGEARHPWAARKPAGTRRPSGGGRKGNKASAEESPARRHL